MAELREHANHLQQENKCLRTCLETNRAENPQGSAQHVPLTQTNKGKEPTLPDHSDPPSNDELSSDSSPLPRHSPPQKMQKLSPERDLLAVPAELLVARIVGCEERPAGIDPIQNWPLSICLPGSGVWPPSFYLRSTHSGWPPPHMPHLIPLSGDRTTCYLPPRARKFWITSLLADSSYRRLPCTTTPLIHMIICCTLTKQ